MNGEKKPVVGIVSFANGDEFHYTDPDEYLQMIKEELPYHPTTGLRFQTLTDDPNVRTAVNALVYDLYGEESPEAEAVKSTYMSGVKSVAQMLLAQDITETKFSPMVVQHPFTNSGITGIPADGRIQLLNLCESQEDLSRWRDTLSAAIDKAEKPMDIYMMLNTPYALTFLKYAEPYLSHKDFSELLGTAWISSEYANSDAEVSRTQLTEMFRHSAPAALMDEEEQAQLAALEDTVTVYRGVTSINSDNLRALSWTLDYETADWFAHRFDENGTVYEAQIDKAHIFALFNGRDESEVVLDPLYLQEIHPAEEQHSVLDLQM